MKVAISLEGNSVSAHFGRCPEFLIADIQSGKLIKSERLSNPGHVPGAIPEFLHSKGVQRIICDGIGARATELFNTYGIQVIAGITGDVDNTLESFMKGTLIANGESSCVPGLGRGYGLDKTICDHLDDD